MTDDLIAWLRAQLDDDERVARAAMRRDGGERGAWFRGGRTIGEHRGTDVWDLNSRSDADRGWYKIGDNLDPEVVEHIARHDPARVLAEVDAKRRILASIATVTLSPWPISVPPEYVEHLNQLLRLLALPYADRPGYREEWRP